MTRPHALRIQHEQLLFICQNLRRIPTRGNKAQPFICLAIEDCYRINISQRYIKAILVNRAGSRRDAKAASLLCQRNCRGDPIGLRVDNRETVRAGIHYVQALAVAARLLRRAANGNGLD